jgi:hypothetical protein
MEMSDQVHALGIPPQEMKPGTHWTGGRLASTAGLCREKYLPLPGTKPQLPACSAHRLGTIPDP